MRILLRIVLFAAVLLTACSPTVTPTPATEIPPPPATATENPPPPATETQVPPSPTASDGAEVITLEGLTVELFPLQGAPTTEPLNFTPLQGTQADVEERAQKMLSSLDVRRLEAANAALKPFDVTIETGDSDSPYRVLQAGQPVLTQPVFGFSTVQVNASGTDFLLRIDASDGSTMLRASSGLQKWDGMVWAVFVGDEVLTAQEVFIPEPAKMQVAVRSGGNDLRTVDAGVPSPVSNLRSLWSDGLQWGVEVAQVESAGENFNVTGVLYLGGESLNAQKGYEEAFQYTTLNGKPFYFYKKNGSIGVAYNWKEQPLQLDEVPHYLCCSTGALNPRDLNGMITFFARRGEQWYYGQVYPNE